MVVKMLIRNLIIFIIILMGFNQANAQNKAELDYNYFAKIPIQHEGRIKPLDTYADILFTSLSGKKSVDGLSSSKLLAELLFDQANSYNRKLFKINNKEVVNILKLKEYGNNYYSFDEIYPAIISRSADINKLIESGNNNMSTGQQQLTELYIKTLWYLDISRSLSMVLPLFSVNDENLAKDLGIKTGDYNYLDFQSFRSNFLKIASNLDSKKIDIKDLSKFENDIINIGINLKSIEKDNKSTLFTIIPGQWQTKDHWLSPWGLFASGDGSPDSAKIMALWQKLSNAYRQMDNNTFVNYSLELYNFTTINAKLNSNKLSSEHFYNLVDPFYVSMILYAIALLLCLLKFRLKINKLNLIANFVIISGLIIHIIGIILRIYILSRPPVSTLYESIIFVSSIIVIGGLFYQFLKPRSEGNFLAAFAGFLLHFIAHKYSAEGDTMGVLIAVLDTNFWLATHVICITIGYGMAIIAALMAHLYLLRMAFGTNKSFNGNTNKNLDKPLTTKLKSIPKKIKPFSSQLESTIQKNNYQNFDNIKSQNKELNIMLLVALLFTATGTYLGGVWADQSWGRFWGWDPKENGALLLVLWIAALLHGKISKIFNDLYFFLFTASTNIIVALAWFGVNLLNVGLHSYGFTANIALNLSLFCGTQMLFLLIMVYLIKRQKCT